MISQHFVPSDIMLVKPSHDKLGCNSPKLIMYINGQPHSRMFIMFSQLCCVYILKFLIAYCIQCLVVSDLGMCSVLCVNIFCTGTSLLCRIPFRCTVEIYLL